jgi:uncharacterized delta-60 repeat protein
MNKKISIIVVTSFFTSTIFSASGTLDTSFGNSGLRLTPMSTSDSLQAIAIQSTDEIVIMGNTQTFGPALFLAEYTSNGTLDTYFDNGGSTPGTQALLIGSQTQGNAVALDSTGNILTAGFACTSSTNIFLARYLSAVNPGTLDPNFNALDTPGYILQSVGNGATANAVGVQSISQSNRIVVAGTSISGGEPSFTLVGFTSTGTLDMSFGTLGITTTQISPISSITAMAIIPSGYYQDYIIVIGDAFGQLTIARYEPTGVLDTSFNSGGAIPGVFQPIISSPVIGYDVIVDSNNNIFVAGSTNIAGINQSLVLKCTPSGALDTANFNNPNGYVTTSIGYGSEFYSLVIQPSTGYIVAAGYATTALSNQFSLVRYTTSGALDFTWGTNGITLTSSGSLAYVQALGVQSTSDIIAAGMSDGIFMLARYNA